MTRYSRELSDMLCDELAAGRTLNSVCKDAGMPSRQAVQKWVAGDVDGFAERYALARRLGYEVLVDQIIDLSDGAGLSNEAVAKARLQVDSRKWLLSKALPKAFGERVTLAGDPDAPLVVEDHRAPIESFLVEFARRADDEPAPSPSALGTPPIVEAALPPESPRARAAPRRAPRIAEPEPEPPPARSVADSPSVDPLVAFRGTGMSDGPEYPDR